MTKGSWVLIAVSGVLTVGAVVAGTMGWGLAEPAKKPMSVREGSVRMKRGPSGTSFFIYGGRGMRGGGLRSGK